ARYTPLKPSCREGRVIRPYLWFVPRANHVARGPWVPARHPVFPAPSVLGGTSFRHRPGAKRAAAMRTRDSVVLRIFRSPTASPSSGDGAALKAGITGSP